ncbi:MAG: succinyldiaminopimelate transaminase [Limnohabitans sp.]
MNSQLTRLHPYPFERLRRLFTGVKGSPNHSPISLGIGEPRHATPALIIEALKTHTDELAAYPSTAGSSQLRQTICHWLKRRYAVDVNPETQVLPVNGSREALFAFAQTVLDGNPQSTVVSPNPFYQIYEGATILCNARINYAPSLPDKNFAIDWDSVTVDIWQNTRLLFVCSPGNPTGAVMPLEEWQKLFALSDKYGFVIASDECYSEIYFGQSAPLGGLQAAVLSGRPDFKHLVCFTSLSKRSNVPGLRSGFVAGDANLIEPFLRFRTYHGSAMGGMVQQASIAAWNDETHVIENRALYKIKFQQVTPLLSQVMDVALPDAGFYLWAAVPGGDDEVFARDLFTQYNVTVLPGRYLAREVNGINPGQGRIRMALVAQPEECLEAARRIVQFVQTFYPSPS